MFLLKCVEVKSWGDWSQWRWEKYFAEDTRRHIGRDSGKIDIIGKISAILELGTGFHPDYSGRENIVMGSGVFVCPMKSRQRFSRSSNSELGSVIDNPLRLIQAVCSKAYVLNSY